MSVTTTSVVPFTDSTPKTTIATITNTFPAGSTVRIDVDTNLDITWAENNDFGRIEFFIDVTGKPEASIVVTSNGVSDSSVDSGVQLHWAPGLYTLSGAITITWAAGFAESDSGSANWSVNGGSTLFVTIY
jgi:hypothetical protein